MRYDQLLFWFWKFMVIYIIFPHILISVGHYELRGKADDWFTRGKNCFSAGPIKLQSASMTLWQGSRSTIAQLRAEKSWTSAQAELGLCAADAQYRSMY